MKKLFAFSIMLCTVLAALADAKIQNGSMINLKDPNARVLITWDYSRMLIEDKTPEAFLAEKGADWQRDYPAEVAAGESAFATKFNKKNKKYALITDDDMAAQYEIVFHVDKFNYGSTATAILFGGFSRGASIEGRGEVINLRTNEVICTFNYDCSGSSGYSNEARRIMAYEDLAEDVAKLVSKAKK